MSWFPAALAGAIVGALLVSLAFSYSGSALPTRSDRVGRVDAAPGPVVVQPQLPPQQPQQPQLPAGSDFNADPLPFVPAVAGPRVDWPVPQSCKEAGELAVALKAPTCAYSNAAYVRELYRRHGGQTCHHARSCTESLYFFDDPEVLWTQRVAHHTLQMSRQHEEIWNCLGGSFWFGYNWEPSVACVLDSRIGKMGDGGKWVCDPHRLGQLTAPFIVYSFGSNNQFDFEEDLLLHLPHSEIHTFDPTSPPPEGAIASRIKFHPVGLGARDGILNLGGRCGSECPVKSLSGLIHELGHEDKVIDIFKVDVEGAEYDTFIDALWTCTFPINIRIILIEIHDFHHGDVNSHLPFDAQRLFLGLMHAGYALYHKEPNAMWTGGNCVEFAFIRLDLHHPA